MSFVWRQLGISAFRCGGFGCRTFLFSGDIMDKTINQRIRYYRKLRCLTQAQVAEAMGMKGSSYSQCEREGKITCEQLIKLSAILNVSCNTLLLGTEEEKTVEKTDITVEEEELKLTNSEKSVIKTIRGFSPEKRKATFKTIFHIWKNNLNPSLLIKLFEE